MNDKINPFFDIAFFQLLERMTKFDHALSIKRLISDFLRKSRDFFHQIEKDN